jgi:hypothetical protein
MYHGAYLVSVASSIPSRAREHSYRRRKDFRSIGLSFHCRRGGFHAGLAPALLFFLPDFHPVLDENDPNVDHVIFDNGAESRNF